MVKRFLNADSYASTGQGFLGYNMFAYCGNNPVNTFDPIGSRPQWERYYGDGVVATTDTGTGTSSSVTVFYNSDQHWYRAANESGQDLCNALGGERYCVIPAETNAFLNSWESLKSPYVLIEVHGSLTSLSTPSSFHINKKQIDKLPRNPKIKCVIITACSTGMEKPGQTSIARKISEKIDPNGVVICATTVVSGNGTSFIPTNCGAWIMYRNGSFVPARLHSVLTMPYVAELVPLEDRK